MRAFQSRIYKLKKTRFMPRSSKFPEKFTPWLIQPKMEIWENGISLVSIWLLHNVIRHLFRTGLRVFFIGLWRDLFEPPDPMDEFERSFKQCSSSTEPYFGWRDEFLTQRWGEILWPCTSTFASPEPSDFSRSVDPLKPRLKNPAQMEQ